MKKFIISLLIVAAFVAIPVSVFAQTTQSTASFANVVDALSLTPAVTGLDFGTFTPGNSGGTVVMTPDDATSAGTRTQTGTVDLITGTTAPTCALYTLEGTPNSEFTVTIPSSSVNLTLTGSPSTIMLLDNFVLYLDGVDNSAALDGSGESAFAVGGTLTVASGQAAGAYTGSFNVTVAYN